MDLKGIAIRIKILRGDYSQKKFGELLGIGQGYIIKIERGHIKPSLEALISISDFCDVSLDYIVKGDNTNPDDYDDADNPIYPQIPIRNHFNIKPYINFIGEVYKYWPVIKELIQEWKLKKMESKTTAEMERHLERHFDPFSIQTTEEAIKSLRQLKKDFLHKA